MIKTALRYFLLLGIIVSSFSLKAISNKKAVADSLMSVHETDSAILFKNYTTIAVSFISVDKKRQKVYLDSAGLLKGSVDDTASIVNLYYTSWGHYYYQCRNFDSSIIMYKRSLESMDPINSKMFNKSYGNIARAYARSDEYDSAIYYYHQSVNVYNQADTTKKVKLAKAYSYNHIGSIYLNIGVYDSSVTYYYHALKIYEDLGNKKRTAIVLMNIGNIYLYHKEYDKALIEYRKGLSLLPDSKEKSRSIRAKLYTNMGLCFKATEMFDTALVYYQNALEIRKQIGPVTSIAGIYDNLGNLNKGQGEFAKALNYYQMALNLRKERSSPRWLAASNGNIGMMYYEMHDFRKSITYLTKAVEISDNNGFVETSIVCKQGLSRAHEQLGEYNKALKYYKEYNELNDSIHSLQLEERLNELKQKYELEKKDRLIQNLEEAGKLSAAKEEKQSVIMNGLLIAAVLLLIILFILQRYFKMKRKADKEIFAKNEQLNQQKTLELMKELEVGSIRSFAEGQEKERSRIAGDLHDRLGSLLSTVKLHFNSLDNAIGNDESAKKSFNFALELLDNSVEEVREVSRNLSKGVLVQFGLIAAVENMSDAINSAGKIKMEVISVGVESRLNSEIEITLFRVVQELITNVIRHAQTNEVFVQFSGAGSHLSIMVEDHGVGFNINDVKSNGIGIENLKSRVQSVGGAFTVDSVIGEGTTIIIEIPY